MKTIGKYEICGLLGRGGMSVVYKARLPVVNKIVALKLLSPHPHLLGILGEEELHRRFVEEAIAIAGLRHPHVVQVLDFDRDRARPFFTMEYYCQNLGIVLGEGSRVESPSRMLSLDKAIYYTRQTLLGLSRLHRSGMVHRDIKPYNLLITDEDNLKISDFGLSKLRRERRINRSNLAVGSPYYAAPEQEKNPEEADKRADLYSVGVILYRMLTGLLPENCSLRPSECHSDADVYWDNFIMKAIARDRKERFPNAEAMLEELNTLDAQWEERKRTFCRMDSSLATSVFPRLVPTRKPLIRPLRSRPVKIAPSQCGPYLDCDELWQPLQYVDNDLHLSEARDTVLDRATDLIWQREASEDPLDWQQAHAYARVLNMKRFGGYTGWRLPSVTELFSLVKPVTLREEDCRQMVFDTGKARLWSADKRSFNAAWYVNAELSFAAWGDFSCRNFVRAVCSRVE